MKIKVFKKLNNSTLEVEIDEKTEKEAINSVLRQFDTEIRLSDVTFRDAGSFDFEPVFEE